VTSRGNWEGRNILHRVAAPADAATEAMLAACRTRLFTIRSRRPRPRRDDKVLADWNGLAIAALCRAAAVFEQPHWRALAAGAFACIMASLAQADGRVRHAWRRHHVSAAGLLEDQAAMARAALALFQATGEASYLEHARALAGAADRWFGDAGGSYFTTAADAADVPLDAAARPRSVTDQATPAGNGLMAEVLARLYHLTGEPAWRQRAEAVLTAFSGLGEHLNAAPTLLAAADLLEQGTVVVIAGNMAGAAGRSLLATALAAPDPAVSVLRAPHLDAVPPLHPAFGKTAPTGEAAAYLCRGGVCGLPISDPDALAAALTERRLVTVS
jgi:uncharacterized protein YyaL (SSP411 family)